MYIYIYIIYINTSFCVCVCHQIVNFYSEIWDLTCQNAWHNAGPTLPRCSPQPGGPEGTKGRKDWMLQYVATGRGGTDDFPSGFMVI